MKVKMNIALQATREYLDDFDESTIPNVGDTIENTYIVERKAIEGNLCVLDVRKKRWNE